MNRVLVIGKGHLGTYLKERWDVSDDMFWTKDMDELDESEIERLAPEVVVNTAGKTSLEWCQQNPIETWRCNATAPLGVMRRVKSVLGSNAPFFHVSSGCVWDGPYDRNGEPFGPYSPPTPAAYYSWSKVGGDAMMMSESLFADLKNVFVLRPRQVFSPVPMQRNTLYKLCSYPDLIDTPNSMTSVSTIALTVERFMQCVSNYYMDPKILCVYDLGTSSPYKVGMRLHQEGLREKPNLVSDKGELDEMFSVQGRPKRVDTVMYDETFESVVHPPTIEESLDRDVQEYATRAWP